MGMRKIKGFLATLLATALGAGFAPRAPGTMGTVMGVFLVYFARDWSLGLWISSVTALFFAGWWASLEWSRNAREPDSQKIVIDEVLGYCVAMGAFPRTPSILFIQFVLFRTFDVLKPPPIRALDRYGKGFPIGPLQSLGVILDDLLAGVYAWGILFLALRLLPEGLREGLLH